MENRIIPGIRKVEYCFAADLNILETDFLQEGDMVNCVSTFYDMEIIGLAKCEVNQKLEAGQMVYETRLNFYTSNPPPVTNQFLCYRLTAVDGKMFLLGTGTRPFPLREFKRSFAEQVTAKQGYDITIRYKNTHSILSIGN